MILVSLFSPAYAQEVQNTSLEVEITDELIEANPPRIEKTLVQSSAEEFKVIPQSEEFDLLIEVSDLDQGKTIDIIYVDLSEIGAGNEFQIR